MMITIIVIIMIIVMMMMMIIIIIIIIIIILVIIIIIIIKLNRGSHKSHPSRCMIMSIRPPSGTFHYSLTQLK